MNCPFELSGFNRVLRHLWLPAVLFFSRAFVAMGQEATGFLLRERFRFTKVDAGIDTTVEQVIFRDGHIVVLIQEPNRSLLQRRLATPEALQASQTTLRVNRIGQQEGDCTAGTTPFDTFQRTLTWFTGGPRGHTLKTGDQFLEPCSARLTAIIDAISSFITTAPAEPGLQDVRVPN